MGAFIKLPAIKEIDSEQNQQTCKCMSSPERVICAKMAHAKNAYAT